MRKEESFGLKLATLRAIVIGMCLLGVGATRCFAQLLISDNFDVGNTNGGAPGGWILTVPSSTQISVVNSTITTASSSPFCVQMIDNSATSRPQMSQNFPATPAGRMSASFKLAAAGKGPCSIQLLTTSGVFLCALVLDTSGLAGYDHTGTGTVDTSVPWKTNAWQKLEVEWFGDGTFNGYLGTTQFVQRVTFATNVPPAQIVLTTGYGSATGRTNYVDDVQGVVTVAQVSDDFDSGNTFGAPPAGWVATVPTGTNIRVVDQTVQAAQSAPNCVEFSDNSATADPQMTQTFTPTPQGRAFFSALIRSTNQAPFYLHLRDTNGTFLTAISLGEDGKMAYNATLGGNGAFTESSLLWVTNIWQTVRVDWFTNNTFNAFLGSNQFAAAVAFPTNLIPGQLLFRLADATRSNRLAYLDDVLVSRSVFPGSALHTNNGVWLSNAYVTTPSMVTNVDSLAFQMSTNYRAAYWFVNVGSLLSSGQLAGAPSQNVSFLNTLKTWETQHGYQFKVLAWINGDTTVVDVSNGTTVTNIIGEAEKFVSTNVAGSYVAGATRTYDGVQIDLEPSGPNGSDTRFNNLKQLMIDIKSGFASLGLPSKLASFSAPSYTTSTNNEWAWTPVYYYYMGVNVDLLAAMTYDSGNTTGSIYQSWIQDQTTNILKAVSGRYWNNDVNHPVPSNGIRVFIGFPAYPNGALHTNTAENIYFAASGVSMAVSNLAAKADLSTNYFQSGSVFLQTDGTGGDGYASYGTDWWWFAQDWLQEW